MDFLEALALEEAVVTISGTFLVIGARDARAMSRGAVRRLAEDSAVAVHMGHGAMTEAAAAGHGPPLVAWEAVAVFLEEASVEEAEVALAAAL